MPPTAIAGHVASRDWDACRREIAVALIANLSRSLTRPQDAVDGPRLHMVHRPGDPLTVRLGSGELARGTYSGLTPEGFLELRQENGIKVISSGDVIADL